MTMNRRDFLRLSLGAAALSINWQLYAAPSDVNKARFLLVFLRGGYDALSLLVPYSEAFYYEMRPTIALAKPHKDDLSSVIALNDDWGLHPSLRDSFYPLYQAKQMAFIPFSGTGFQSRSHFQTQDWLEYGQGAANLNPDSSSGFLNRLLHYLHQGHATQDNAVSFTQQLPLALQGRIPVANSPIIVRGKQTMTASYEQLVQTLYAEHPLGALAREGLNLRHKISQELQEEMQSASRAAVPARGFALEAQRVAKLLREQPNYKIGFIDVGGWDSHIDQGAAHGQFSRHIEDLGAGLAGLAETLGTEWKNTVVALISEFGRTFQENGSRGTDHGYGSTLCLLGGGLHGGVIKGEQTRLNRPAALHENRDTPMLNEYRGVLAGVFKQLYGLNANALNTVFPNVTVRDLGLL